MSHLFSAAFYIDPATTSYIIQILVGAVVAVGAVIGIFGNKLKRLLRKKKSDEALPAAERAGAGKGKKDISAADLLADDSDEAGE